jgi:p-hydroxybenzoate 3-monooxygenase
MSAHVAPGAPTPARHLHRIDLHELTGGRAVTVYAQHEVLMDLIAKRLADGGDMRFGVSDTTVDRVTDDQPTLSFTHDGRRHTLECDSSSAATAPARTPGS